MNDFSSIDFDECVSKKIHFDVLCTVIRNIRQRQEGYRNVKMGNIYLVSTIYIKKIKDFWCFFSKILSFICMFQDFCVSLHRNIISLVRRYYNWFPFLNQVVFCWFLARWTIMLFLSWWLSNDILIKLNEAFTIGNKNPKQIADMASVSDYLLSYSSLIFHSLIVRWVLSKLMPIFTSRLPSEW